MIRIVRLLPLVAMVVAGGLLGGCNTESDSSILLSYDKPAKFPVESRIKRIAVAEFSGASEMDQRWGDIAAGKLSDELGKSSRESHRYELVDRRNLAKIMREQDIKIMNSEQDAVKVGKLANVQAMIYGNIRVNAKDERYMASYFDIFSQTTKTKPKTKRFVLVSVNLSMTDIDNGKVILPYTLTKEFDSEKASSGMAAAFGFGSDTPPPVDQTVNKVMDEVVQEFAQQICPYRMEVKVHLESGKTKGVERGNVLAKSKDYPGALEMYKAALAEMPKDDGANFNAGAMCEAQGDFGGAEQYYTRAFGLSGDDKKTQQKYADARQRVRAEGAKSTPGNGK